MTSGARSMRMPPAIRQEAFYRLLWTRLFLATPFEAVGLRGVPEELGDQALLGSGELGRVAGRRPRPQRLGAALAGAGEPTADGLLGDAQGRGGVALMPASLLQVQRPQPPPL